MMYYVFLDDVLRYHYDVLRTKIDVWLTPK